MVEPDLDLMTHCWRFDRQGLSLAEPSVSILASDGL